MCQGGTGNPSAHCSIKVQLMTAGSGRSRKAGLSVRGSRVGSHLAAGEPFAALAVQGSGKSRHPAPQMTPKHVSNRSPCPSQWVCWSVARWLGVSEWAAPGALPALGRTSLFAEQQALTAQGHQPCCALFCFFTGIYADPNLVLIKHSQQKCKTGVHRDSAEYGREAFSDTSRCK